MWREHGVRLLAVLARDLRSLDIAEEALQEAQVAALRQWPAEGVPASPAGWLRTVALRRGRDRLRREATLARKLPLLVVDPVAPDDEPDEVSPIADERLRLVFTACHPALAMPARVALTLRYAAGLTTPEIARLFLVPVPTMAARLTRAKAKIAAAGIPYRVPADADLPERLAGVLAVVYLVFTEGYLPATGDRLVRAELCAEAIRLGGLLDELMPDEPEVLGLLALMRIQHARRDARADAGGLVRLADQDRARWHADEIAAGLAELERAARHRPPGPYAVQAAIAAEHATAPSAAATDWPAIAALYGELERLTPTAAVRLNRAVAVAEAGDPAGALALLEGLDGALAGRHALPAARAELLARLGRTADAARAYDAAIALAGNAVVRAHLCRRRSGLDSYRMAQEDLELEIEEQPELDPETRARREAALRFVRKHGDPVLRSRAREVETFDDRLVEEVHRMGDIMHDALGIGLAATQLGVMHRVLVYRVESDAPVVALVNPVLEWSSKEEESMDEGCLSLPGVLVEVDRPVHVRVRAADEHGEPIVVEASGLEARVIQHEMDHLDGTLILDRTSRDQRKRAMRALREAEQAASAA